MASNTQNYSEPLTFLYIYRAGLMNSLSPTRNLIQPLALPFISPIGVGGLAKSQSVVKLPTINPVLQAAGLQTIAANPLIAAGSPGLPPPVPLLPPALFGSVPSLPDLKNPLLSDLYWRGGGYGLHGDYVRGRGLNNGLILGANLEGEKLKKALYRNDLLNQMDDNKLRRVERYNINRIEGELEEDRLRRERFYMDRGYDYYNIHDKRRRIIDNQERAARHLRENWHRQDEDRYHYKRFRKGNDPVEAYWLDGNHPHNSRYWRHQGPNADWYKKYWSHPAWWNSKDPYPYPPVGGHPQDRDWWWYGDRYDPAKDKGYWHKGKWVPLDVANTIQERVGKEVEKIRGEMVQGEMDLQQQLNEMKRQTADADRERYEALASVKHLKERLDDQQLTEDIRHNYIYHQMLNNMQEKDQLIQKRTEVLPEITTMSRIEKVQFKLPEKPSERYDTKDPISRNLKFIGDKDSIDKLKTRVSIKDADYLNKVNTKRLDDLRGIDTRHELSKDKLADYLDRETSASRIRLHDPDARNELMSQDLLKPGELPNVSDYQTPIKVVDKFNQSSKYPSLDEIMVSSTHAKTPISQKIIIKSHSKSSL